MKLIVIALLFNFIISCWPKVDIKSAYVKSSIHEDSTETKSLLIGSSIICDIHRQSSQSMISVLVSLTFS